MNYHDLTPDELLRKLSFAGRYPKPDLIDAICERRSETEPLLLAMFGEAYHDNWPSHDDPRWYRFTHAGKFMLSWQNLDALPVFADLYMDDEPDMQDLCEWFEVDLYHYGPAAIPTLQQIVEKDSGGRWHYGRALGGGTLSRIATYYPHTRDEVAAIIRAQLPSLEMIPDLEDEDEIWSSFVSDLAKLADEASREQVLALFDAGLSENFIRRNDYLRAMKRGFRPEKPPKPYSISKDYQAWYEEHLQMLREEERERQQRRESRIRQAGKRIGPKIGRNEPCPCGSGKKYKKCHGRPGA